MPLGNLLFTLITLVIGASASIPALYDPEGTARDYVSDSYSRLWNSKPPMRNRWYVPKPFPTPRPVVVNKKSMETVRANPALWNDATRMVQTAISRMMDEIDFGLQLTERDQDLNDIMDQVRHLTGFVQDFYSEMKRHEGASNLMSIWKGSAPPGSTFPGNVGEGAGSNLSRFVRKGTSYEGTLPLSTKQTSEPQPTLSPQHYVLPSTAPRLATTSTEVPEIYYEIFKAYKDRRRQQ